MEKLIYCLLALSVIFAVAYLLHRLKKDKQQTTPPPTSKPQETPDIIETLRSSWGDLITECEEKLDPRHRGLIKLVFEKENPDKPAALKIGNLKISLLRYGTFESLHLVSSPLEALYIARDGYHGTGRYIPIPEEVGFILSYQTAINVYLEALNLATLSSNDPYWCIDTTSGPETGWNKFGWNVNNVIAKLGDKFRVRTPSGYQNTPPHGVAYLFVLLKSWDYLFVEI